jgi:hypothetical protein
LTKKPKARIPIGIPGLWYEKKNGLKVKKVHFPCFAEKEVEKDT